MFTSVDQLKGEPSWGKRGREGACLRVKIPFALRMILALMSVLPAITWLLLQRHPQLRLPKVNFVTFL